MVGRTALMILAAWLGIVTAGQAQLSLASPDKSIWNNDVGSGFARGTQTLSLEAGANYGLAAFGSKQAHDLALVSLSYGRMFSSVLAQDRWYRGILSGARSYSGARNSLRMSNGSSA